MNILEQAIEEPELRNLPCAPEDPISIYQVHLPSWMRVPEEQNRPLDYFEIAPKLAEHAERLRFTHVQLHAPDFSDSEGLKHLIHLLHQHDLGVILETDLPFKTTNPFDLNGLSADGKYADGETLISGYNYEWDCGWVEDTLAYFATDPLYRKFRQGQFTRRDSYAFAAHHILPLSGRFVAQPRPSLLLTVPGDEWQKFANLRLLYAYTFLLPGKKLLFMGDEFGQTNSWRKETSLDWHLVTDTSPHGKLMQWVTHLNRFYRDERVLHQTDSHAEGFQWMDTSDAASSIISFLRKDSGGDETFLAVLNFTPVVRHNYRVGVPAGGFWKEVLNSDALEFGGSGQGNLGGLEAAPFGWNFQSHSLMLTLPPLAAVVLKASNQ